MNSTHEETSDITYFHIFPALNLPDNIVSIADVTLKSKNQLNNEPVKKQNFLNYVFSLFKDPYGDELKYGYYVIRETTSSIEIIWFLLRFAAYIPSQADDIHQQRRSPDLADWFEFPTSGDFPDNEDQYLATSVYRNGAEIWNVFWRTDFFEQIARFHSASESLSLSPNELRFASRLAELFAFDGEYDPETAQLAERLRKAIYWYNKSFETGLKKDSYIREDLESQILHMAVAFEALFKPPKSGIQKHLETSLKVLFPDNEFVPKWLSQFYAARSTVAHGSTLDESKWRFRPDREEHYSLTFWARKIFRTCVESMVAQWKAAQQSGLLKLMTPNRISLQRIQGKLRSAHGKGVLRHIPTDIRTDIRDLHASFIDTPDDSFVEHTANISNILFQVALESQDITHSELCALLNEFLALPPNWYEQEKTRRKAIGILSSIVERYGDEGHLLGPLIDLSDGTETDYVLYHWSRFAYDHIRLAND